MISPALTDALRLWLDHQRALAGAAVIAFVLYAALLPDWLGNALERSLAGARGELEAARLAADEARREVGTRFDTLRKQGRTARAMRTILSAASTKIRKRAVVDVIEEP